MTNHLPSRLTVVWIVFVLLANLLPACGAPVVTGTSLPAATEVRSSFDSIDTAIEGALSGALAYNAPAAMDLEESKTIQLLISPSLSPEALEQQLRQNDPSVGATIKITPRMKAELRGADPEAFTIQALHDQPEQLLSNAEPAEWRWTVTARKPGRQEMILTVYRLIEYEGKEYWRQVSYENRIEVTVTLAQRLTQFDWQWLAGIGLTGLLIPALWRWTNRRRKDPARHKKDKPA